MVIHQQKSRGRLKRGHSLARRTMMTFTTYHVDRVLHMEDEVEERKDILRGARSFLELEHELSGGSKLTRKI